MLAPGLLALALLAAWLLPGEPIDLVAVLLGGGFGRAGDLALVWVLGGVVLLALALVWRPLVAAAFDPETAEAEGLPLRRAELAFALVTALTAALATLLVGALFAAALLILPAATAQRLAATPERMAAMASLTAAAAAAAGLLAADRLAMPAGPPVTAAALALYLFARLARRGGGP
jgi:zinc transport system permease protein